MTSPDQQALALIRESIAQFTEVPADQILPDTLLSDLNVDSLSLGELLFELEDKLNISVSQLTSIPKSIGDIVTLIAPHLAK